MSYGRHSSCSTATASRLAGLYGVDFSKELGKSLVGARIIGRRK
jgi:hypothetical protein